MTARFDHIGGLTEKVPVILVGLAIVWVTLIGVNSNNPRARVTLQINQAQDNLPQKIAQRC